MEESQKTPSFKSKLQNTKRNFFKMYYGNPAKALKLILITGQNGVTTTANFVQNILRADGKKSELILLSPDQPLSFGKLQKNLSMAVQNHTHFIVIGAPAGSLDVFSDLPLHIAAIIDTASLDAAETPEAILPSLTSIFQQKPTFSVLNIDDANFANLAALSSESTLISFGRSRDANIRINRSKVYKKGTEANLSTKHSAFDVATFATGEENALFMAAATAIAETLDITPDPIIDGIASYEP